MLPDINLNDGQQIVWSLILWWVVMMLWLCSGAVMVCDFGYVYSSQACLPM